VRTARLCFSSAPTSADIGQKILQVRAGREKKAQAAEASLAVMDEDGVATEASPPSIVIAQQSLAFSLFGSKAGSAPSLIRKHSRTQAGSRLPSESSILGDGESHISNEVVDPTAKTDAIHFPTILAGIDQLKQKRRRLRESTESHVARATAGDEDAKLAVKNGMALQALCGHSQELSKADFVMSADSDDLLKMLDGVSAQMAMYGQLWPVAGAWTLVKRFGGDLAREFVASGDETVLDNCVSTSAAWSQIQDSDGDDVLAPQDCVDYTFDPCAPKAYGVGTLTSGDEELEACVTESHNVFGSVVYDYLLAQIVKGLTGPVAESVSLDRLDKLEAKLAGQSASIPQVSQDFVGAIIECVQGFIHLLRVDDEEYSDQYDNLEKLSTTNPDEAQAANWWATAKENNPYIQSLVESYKAVKLTNSKCVAEVALRKEEISAASQAGGMEYKAALMKAVQRIAMLRGGSRDGVVAPLEKMLLQGGTLIGNEALAVAKQVAKGKVVVDSGFVQNAEALKSYLNAMIAEKLVSPVITNASIELESVWRLITSGVDQQTLEPELNGMDVKILMTDQAKRRASMATLRTCADAYGSDDVIPASSQAKSVALFKQFIAQITEFVDFDKNQTAATEIAPLLDLLTCFCDPVLKASMSRSVNVIRLVSDLQMNAFEYHSLEPLPRVQADGHAKRLLALRSSKTEVEDKLKMAAIVGNAFVPKYDDKLEEIENTLQADGRLHLDQIKAVMVKILDTPFDGTEAGPTLRSIQGGCATGEAWSEGFDDKASYAELLSKWMTTGALQDPTKFEDRVNALHNKVTEFISMVEKIGVTLTPDDTDTYDISPFEQAVGRMRTTIAEGLVFFYVESSTVASKRKAGIGKYQSVWSKQHVNMHPALKVAVQRVMQHKKP